MADPTSDLVAALRRAADRCDAEIREFRGYNPNHDEIWGEKGEPCEPCTQLNADARLLREHADRWEAAQEKVGPAGRVALALIHPAKLRAPLGFDYELEGVGGEHAEEEERKQQWE